MATVLTSGDDTFSVTTSDTIFALAGNDSVTDHAAGNNIIIGDIGNDDLGVATENNILLGGMGDDSLSSGGIGGGQNVLFGGEGNDSIGLSGSDDQAFGGLGDDNLFSVEGGSGLQYGGEGNDTLSAYFGLDVTMSGGGGDDLIEAYDVFSSTGNPIRVYGGSGNDTLYGVSDFFEEGDTGIIVGAALVEANPGVGEIDTLIAGGGSNTIVLGTLNKTFYDDGNSQTVGTDDYAVIVDFQSDGLANDFIQLHGTPDDYVLGVSPIPELPGTAIYLDQPATEPDELIAIVQGVSLSSLSLEGSYFQYV